MSQCECFVCQWNMEFGHVFGPPWLGLSEEDINSIMKEVGDSIWTQMRDDPAADAVWLSMQKYGRPDAVEWYERPWLM